MSIVSYQRCKCIFVHLEMANVCVNHIVGNNMYLINREQFRAVRRPLKKKKKN